jgi:membrane peptidoglycan carboxypeptidase
MQSLYASRMARLRRQRRRQQRASAPRVLRWLGVLTAVIISLVLVLSLALTGVGWFVYRHYADQLPAPSAIDRYYNQLIPGDGEAFYAARAGTSGQGAFLTTVLYDRAGQTVLYEVIDPVGGDRRLVAIDDVPRYFLDATVAIEDASFYDNPGFDLEGIARALWNNITGGQIQGGSTITQQLVRNVLLAPEERNAPTLDRKIKEVILAVELSQEYSKDQILEWYINTNYYGGWAYGIEAAAQQYFSKPARDLSLAEATMLAAIPQFPFQNPINNPTAAKTRQELVLQAMVDQGYLTQSEADAAFAKSIAVRPFAERYDILAPHFSMYARAQAEAILDDIGLDGAQLVTRGGLRIYTTLDLDLQLQVECVAQSHVERLAGADPQFTHNTSLGENCAAAIKYLPALPVEMAGVSRNVSNAGAVVMRAQTGELLAMVGSVDYWDAGIDGTYNVTLAQRQPASAFKPMVYMAAFLAGPVTGYSSGITAASMVYDVPIEFDNRGRPYTPTNIDNRYHGLLSVRDALANSYNVPPVQLANLIGIGPIVQTAHRLGINSLNNADYGLALALGSGEVSLLDLTYAYNVFNTGGYMVGMPVFEYQSVPGFRSLNPVAVLRIEDANGNVLWQYGQETSTYQRRLILEPGLAYLMNNILSDVAAREPAFGAGNPMELSRPAASKTGTSNDNRDAWTVGYTPQVVAGVWVGNNDNRPMGDAVTGVTAAAPIWHAIMEYAHARDNLPLEGWQRPPSVREATVCEKSGLLPTANCRQTRELFYVDPPIDTRPQQPDTYWQAYRINACNGRLATEASPSGCVEERTYFDYPPAARTWALNAGKDFPPTERDIGGSSSPFLPVAFITPDELDRVSGVVAVRGNATDDDFAYYRLDYGVDGQQDVWVQIGTDGTEPGRSIVLGQWDTTGLIDGVYTLRLTMVRSDNTLETASVEVTVDNTPPRAALVAPDAARTFSAAGDVYVPLQAEVTDNVQLTRVEFYIDGQQFASLDAAPYTARWQISGAPGPYTFWAVAYDAAGNRAESEHVTINVVP